MFLLGGNELFYLFVCFVVGEFSGNFFIGF